MDFYVNAISSRRVPEYYSQPLEFQMKELGSFATVVPDYPHMRSCLFGFHLADLFTSLQMLLPVMG